MPPSSLQMSPVAQGFFIIPSTANANYLEFPSLPKGVFWIILSRNFLLIPLPIGVSNIPGAIVITRILYLPKSLAIGNVIPINAPFEAEQTTWPFCPSKPATLATLMMTPLSPSTSSCSDIALAACLDTLRVPITLILSTFSIFSDDTTPFENMVVPAAIIPAQFTTTCIFLQFYVVNFMSYCTFFQSATLVLKKRHPSLPAVSLPKSSLRSAMTTCTPWDLSNSTVARPSPEAPPVTIATKDLSSLMQCYKVNNYKMDLTVGKHYKLTKKLNSGSFGQIYLAINLTNNREVAVKLQPITTKHPQLQYEAKLLAYLNNNQKEVEGFSAIYYFGKDQNYNIMVQELLGPSLEQLFQKCGKRFDLKTTVMVGLQIVDRLEYMHNMKFVHRDIKPDNFLLGTYEKCNKIYVIDFGLSKKFVQKNGAHISYKDNKSLTGTPRYASINNHLGIQQSRRDDLESVIYMLIYFLKGSLPWQNLKQDSNYGKYQKILEKKLSISVQNLVKDIPKQFGEMLEYARKLHFTEEPKYNVFRKLMEQALLKEGTQLNRNDLFCWEIANQKQKESPKAQVQTQVKVQAPTSPKKVQNFEDEDFNFDQY